MIGAVPGHEALPPPGGGHHSPAHHGVHHHQRHHRDQEEDDGGELVEEGRDLQHGAEGGGHDILPGVWITNKIFIKHYFGKFNKIILDEN